MNTRKITHEAESAWKAYKRSDPIMVRKSVSLKDVAYRKSTPGREVWHAEVSFDYDFYMAVLALIVAAVVLCAACRRMSKKFCSLPHKKKR